MAKQLWNFNLTDPSGLKKKKEEEERKKKQQALAYAHNAPVKNNVPEINLSRKAVEDNSPYAIKFDTSSTANAVPLPLEGKARGSRGTRSKEQQEEYKRQAEENSYNIRRETALKNNSYFKELNDGSDISSDRRSFLENELDLYARDDKDWYWGRSLREAQKREQDEFNRLSALVKTPEWKNMTPEQQEAERARLAGARDEVDAAKKQYVADEEHRAEFKLQQAWNVDNVRNDYINKGKGNSNNPRNHENGEGAYDFRVLDDAEKEYVDFVFGYYDKDTAFRKYRSLINEKANKQLIDSAKDNALVRNVAAPLINVSNNLVAAPVYMGEVLTQGAKNVISGVPRNMPADTVGTQLMKTADASREAFAGDSKIKGLALDTVNSITPAMFGAAAPVVYGMQSGGRSAYDTIQKGGSVGQAGTSAVMNAVVSGVISKYGFDKFFEGGNLARNALKSGLKKDIIKALGMYTLQQGGAETLEEGVESYADTIIDVLVNGDNSDMARLYDAHIKNGHTPEQAQRMTLTTKFLTEPTLSAALGGLMGMIIGDVNIAANVGGAYLGYKKSPGSVSADVGGVNIREGMTAEEVLEQLRSLPQSDGNDVQYAIETVGDKKFVRADRQVITGNDPEAWGESVENYINNNIRNNRDVSFIGVDGDVLTITKDTAGKAKFRNEVTQADGTKRLLTDEEYKAKLRAESHIDELAQVSKRGKKDSPDSKQHDFAKDGFNYRTAYFLDNDGQYYRLTISVGKNGEINTVYNVGRMKNEELPLGIQDPSGKTANGSSSYINNTTGADESQGEFAYKDADVPNTPLADALGNIDINSIYGDGENDAGNEWQAATPHPSAGADTFPSRGRLGERMELKGRSEFDSDEAYAHYLIDVGQKELAKVPKITRAFLEAIARRTGLKIVIGDTGAITGQKSAGGYSRSRDMLVLDYDTVSSPDKLARAVINHELVHATETSMFYKSLEKHAFEQMFGGDEDALNDAIKKKQERYAKSGVPLGRSGAEAELVASYIGESVLTSEEAINRLVIEKPTLAMQIKNALVKTYDKAKTYFTDKEAYEARYAMSDLEKGIKLFEKALDTRRNFKDFAQRLSGNVGGDVQYSTSKSFKEQVSETLHTKIDDGNHVYVRDTSSILKQVGLNSKPMLMTRGHLRDIHHPKDGINSKYHGLSEKTINELPKILDYPAIIFDSISPNSPDAVCILSEKLADDGNPILVAIKPDGRGNFNHVEIESNFITSMYGRSGIKGFLNNLASQSDNVLFIDNKRTQELLKPRRLQLPADLSKLKFNTILHQSKNVVKNDFQFAKPIVHGMRKQVLVDSKGNTLHIGDRVIAEDKAEGVVTWLDKYGNAEVTFEIEDNEYIIQRFSSDDDYNVTGLTRTDTERDKKITDRIMGAADSGSADRVPSPGKGLYEYGARNLMTKEEAERARQEKEQNEASAAEPVQAEIDEATEGAAVADVIERVERETTGAEVTGVDVTESAAETQQESTDSAHVGMKMDTDGEYYKDVPYEDANEKEFSKGFNRPWAKLKKRAYENGRESLVFEFDRSVKAAFSDSEEYKALINNADKYEDVTGFLLTPERALEKTFGKDYGLWLKTGQKAVEDAKMQYQYILSYLAADLKKNIIDKYGFKAKSLESDLIQAYGEGVKSEAEIKRELNKKYKNKEKADEVFEQIKDAEKWFRKTYDTLRHSINDTKQEIYPEVENIISKYEDRLNEIDEQLILLKSGSSSALLKAESARNRTEKIKQSKENAIRYIDGTIKELGIKLRKVNDSIDSKKRTDTKVYTNLLIRADNIRGSIERMKKLKEDYVAKSDEEYEKSVRRFEAMQEKAEQSTEKRVAQLEKRRGEIEEKLASEELWRNKRIPERKNYFRHHKAQMEKWSISNLFKGKANMTSQSTGTGSGTGKYSKSKYSWQSFAQRRRGDTPYVSDAIGGFLDYLPNAVYTMTLDPVGEMYRSVAKDMRNNESVGAELPKTSALLDGLADEYLGKERSGLDDWAKSQFGTSYKRFNKAIGFVKKGHLLFSVRTAMVQASNLGNGFAYVKPQHMLTSMLHHKKKYGRADSAFMSERYSDVLSQFDKSYNKPKKFADWMMNVLDKKVAEIIWDAAYSQAISENRDNPVQWADIQTRKSIGGRGIGERSGFQVSKALTSVMSPYSLETFNDVQVLTDVFKEAHGKGKFGPKVRNVIAKLISMYLTTALIDFVVDKISGSKTGKFNPFGTLIEDILNPDEEKTTKENMLEAGASLLGNFVGSLPMGYEIASVYPEQGIKYGLDGNKKVLSRKDVFGSEDPTEFSRAPFGLVGSLMNNPLNMIPGYNQVQKTYNGIKTVYEGGSYKTTYREDDKGNAVEEKQLQYPIYNDNKAEQLRNFIQAGLFGKSALPEAQRWVDNGFDTLNADDTARYDKIKGSGSNRELYDTLLELSHTEAVKNKAGDTLLTKNQVRHNTIRNSKIDEGHQAWLEISYWDEKKQEKAQAAADAGINNDIYVDMNHLMSSKNKKYYESYLTQRQKNLFDATPKKENFSEYRRYVLMNDNTLTPEQKRYLDNDFLMDEGEVTQYDYTSMNAFILSGMTESQNRKYAVTNARLGLSPELYKYYLNVAGSDGKDDEKKARLRANGMNAAAADIFYDSAIKNAKAGDIHDRTAYGNMTDKEKQVFGTLKGRGEFKDMEASDFAYYITCVQNLKSDSDKIARLKKCSLGKGKISAAQAKEIVRLLK